MLVERNAKCPLSNALATPWLTLSQMLATPPTRICIMDREIGRQTDRGERESMSSQKFHSPVSTNIRRRLVQSKLGGVWSSRQSILVTNWVLYLCLPSNHCGLFILVQHPIFTVNVPSATSSPATRHCNIAAMFSTKLRN